MAYVGDFVEFLVPDIEQASGIAPIIGLKCWDNITGLDITDQSIEDMSVGGKYLFPIVYEFDGNMVDISGSIDLCEVSEYGSLSLSDIVQAKNGGAVQYRVNALKPINGDDCIEFVLSDAVSGDIHADFSFSPILGVAPMQVRFTDNSTSFMGIDTYYWEFGDGTFSSQKDPIHVFNITGFVNVKLTVYGADGESSITKTLIIMLGSSMWGKASDYLIQQYKESVSVVSLIDMHEARMKEIVDLSVIMPPAMHYLGIAEGVQLDNIGKTVDAGRGSLTDADYRIWIDFIQRVNAAGGEPEIIIEYIRRYCGDYLLNMLFDDGNAAVNIQLMTQGMLPDGFLEELVYQLSRIVPAGVEVRLFHSATGDVFAVADEGGDTTTGAGFSEEDAEFPSYFYRTTGGQFIDPIHI